MSLTTSVAVTAPLPSVSPFTSTGSTVVFIVVVTGAGVVVTTGVVTAGSFEPEALKRFLKIS